MKVVASVLAAGLLATWIGACSSTPSASTSASASVCHARSDLQSAVQSFRTSVSNANFGQARTDLTNVSSAADHLAQEVKKLKASEQQALTPQIDALKSEIANLKNVRSLSALTASLNTISSQAQSIYSQVTDTVKCP
jgi:predicted  nucleic acid-binding Zn-ribbon protein